MKVTAGSQIGPYQVVEQVGRGGMATVFKAYQPALERMVAIKVLPDFLAEDPEFRERFRREAVAIAKLRHPNILAVFDHGEIEGQPYIVTEFVEGGTFAAELGKPVGLPRALDVLRSVASALDYAHQRGILHRDVKPSNILVTKDGTSVLGDFGLARMMATNERLTRFDMVVGTPEYMSPEQCAGTETGPASDQYALGVVAFEALTGHVPYHAETPAAVMLAQMQAPLPMARTVNPGLPVAVERALMRALAKEPGDRYPNCTAFIEALTDSSTEVAAVPSPSRAAPATTAISPPKARSAPAGIAWRPARQPMVIGAAAVAVLLLLGAWRTQSRAPRRVLSVWRAPALRMAASSTTPTSASPRGLKENRRLTLRVRLRSATAARSTSGSTRTARSAGSSTPQPSRTMSPTWSFASILEATSRSTGTSEAPVRTKRRRCSSTSRSRKRR